MISDPTLAALAEWQSAADGREIQCDGRRFAGLGFVWFVTVCQQDGPHGSDARLFAGANLRTPLRQAAREVTKRPTD